MYSLQYLQDSNDAEKRTGKVGGRQTASSREEKSVLAEGRCVEVEEGKSKEVEKRQSREGAGRPGDRGVCEPRSKCTRCTTARHI